MRTFGFSAMAVALVLDACALQAQETNQIEQLKRQLEQMQQNFDRVVREQQAQIDALKKQLTGLTNAPPTTATVTQAPPPVVAGVEPRPAQMAPGSEAVTAQPWSPEQPIRLGTAQNYVSISFDALVAAGTSTANDIEDGTQLG